MSNIKKQTNQPQIFAISDTDFSTIYPEVSLSYHLSVARVALGSQNTKVPPIQYLEEVHNWKGQNSIMEGNLAIGSGIQALALSLTTSMSSDKVLGPGLLTRTWRGWLRRTIYSTALWCSLIIPETLGSAAGKLPGEAGHMPGLPRWARALDFAPQLGVLQTPLPHWIYRTLALLCHWFAGTYLYH